jgi:mRNA interferase HicA
MKRVDPIRHLERCGCEFFGEGGNHTVYVNRSAGKSSPVPRHREVNEFLARKIGALRVHYTQKKSFKSIILPASIFRLAL